MAEQNNEMTVIRIGVIGIGNIGSVHANCIYGGKISGMKLVAICDVDSSKCEQFLKGKYDVRCYTDWHDLLCDCEVDAVIVATPHPMHADIAIETLKANKHVLLEKPVDISVTKAKKLNEIAKKSQKVFAIMFNQRTNELFIKARQIVKSGELGELKRSVWIITNWYRTQAYYDSAVWRATWLGEGGGVLLNQAPHNLDIWQWICGMPCEITAFCDIGKYHDIETEDDVTIFARYSDGATGTFVTSTGEYPGTNRLEISGTLGKIVLENGLLKWWKLKNSERDVCKSAINGYAQIETEYIEMKQGIEDTAHLGILQNFANHILWGEDLISPGVEGINELMISNAAYLSSWKGNIPVPVPVNNEEFDCLIEQKRKASYLKNVEAVQKSNAEYKARWQTNW